MRFRCARVNVKGHRAGGREKWEGKIKRGIMDHECTFGEGMHDNTPNGLPDVPPDGPLNGTLKRTPE